MRKLVVTEFMTLDGNIGAPMWSFPYWGDDIAAFKAEETDSSDTLLLGRVTYEGFAAAWPGRPAEEGGDYFNGVEKVVVTNTLDHLEWQNSHRLEGDLIEGVKALEGTRWHRTSPSTAAAPSHASLIKAGLVDSIRVDHLPAHGRRRPAALRGRHGEQVPAGRGEAVCLGRGGVGVRTGRVNNAA